MKRLLREPKRLGSRKNAMRLAALLLVAAVGAVAAAMLLNPSEEPATNSSDADVVTHSTDTPDETRPTAAYNWKGGPKDPKTISISRIGVNGFIQKVGVDQNRQVAVPNNVFVGGWFVDSVRPGEKGLSIIDGHINGRQQDGAIFQRLPYVTDGDMVTVTFGDDGSKTFEVFATHDLPVKDVPNVLFSQNPSVTNQLNLITCVGRYDKVSQSYDRRFVVYTKLVTDPARVEEQSL